MKNSYNRLWFVIILCTSCVSIRYMDIQVLTPSENTLPSNIEHLFIINSQRYAEVVDTGLYQYFIQNLYPALTKNMEMSPSYANTKFQIVSWSEYRNYYTGATFNERKQSSFLLLDSAILQDTIYIARSFSEEFQNADGTAYYDFLYTTHRINYTLQFHLQNLVFGSNSRTIVLKDTARWESLLSMHYTLDSASNSRPNNYKELATIVAEQYVKKVAPYWNTAERAIFYTPNKNMRKAYNYFLENNIDSTIVFWSAAYHEGNAKQAARAAFNLALTYEVADKINSSKYWIDKALLHANDSVYLHYRKIIQKRIDEKATIDLQLRKP